MSVSARGGPERTTRGFAGAMRRTDRAVCRGTSLQGCDRTAGDSRPGHPRERSAPGTPGAARRNLHRSGRNGCGLRHPSRTMREQPKSPHGQPNSSRTANGRHHPHAPSAPGRRPAAPEPAAHPPAPLPRHRRCPDVGADAEGPCGFRPAGPFAMSVRGTKCSPGFRISHLQRPPGVSSGSSYSSARRSPRSDSQSCAQCRSSAISSEPSP